MLPNKLAAGRSVPVHCVDLDRSLSPAQCDARSGSNGQIRGSDCGAQQVRRDQERFVGGFALVAQQGGDVHRVAEIRDLPLSVATLADHDGSGMNAGAEAGRDAEFPLVSRRQFRHPVLDRKKALQRISVPLRAAAERPGDDHRVADIGVHLAAIFGNWLVDIEKELGNEVVH